MENELGGKFVLSWEKAKSGWNDESSAEFEKNHIDELREILDQILTLDEEIQADWIQISRMM